MQALPKSIETDRDHPPNVGLIPAQTGKKTELMTKQISEDKNHFVDVAKSPRLLCDRVAVLNGDVHSAQDTRTSAQAMKRLVTGQPSGTQSGRGPPHHRVLVPDLGTVYIGEIMRALTMNWT